MSHKFTYVSSQMHTCRILIFQFLSKAVTWQDTTVWSSMCTDERVGVCVLRNLTGMLCGETVALSDLWEWKTTCKRRCESVTSEVGASFLTRSFSWKVLLAVLLLHTRPAKVRTNVIEVFKKEVGGVALLQHVVFLTMDGSPWKCLMEGGEIHNFLKNIHSF